MILDASRYAPCLGKLQSRITLHFTSFIRVSKDLALHAMAIHSKPLAKTLFHSPAVSSPNPLIWILHLSWYIPLRTVALSWGVSVRPCKEGSQPSLQCCLTRHHTSVPHPAQGILPISGSLGGDPSIYLWIPTVLMIRGLPPTYQGPEFRTRSLSPGTLLWKSLWSE